MRRLIQSAMILALLSAGPACSVGSSARCDGTARRAPLTDGKAAALATQPQQALFFSGRTWQVRTEFGHPGPYNYFSNRPEVVHVDALGQLHLRIARLGTQWVSSEVSLPTSLGYGTYEFVFASRMDLIDVNAVAAPFLYADDTHEFDFEFARWKSPHGPNGQCVVQPWSTEGNRTRFRLDLAGARASTYRIIWTPDLVRFESAVGDTVLQSWDYTGPNNFAPGPERVHINFWQVDASPPSTGTTQEIVVKSFAFTPLALAAGPGAAAKMASF